MSGIKNGEAFSAAAFSCRVTALFDDLDDRAIRWLDQIHAVI
jgi:hypothetical protein